jgi:hypothetical protein
VDVMVSHQDMARSCGGGRTRTIDGHEDMGESTRLCHGGGVAVAVAAVAVAVEVAVTSVGTYSILCTSSIKRGRGASEGAPSVWYAIGRRNDSSPTYLS